MQEQHYLVPHQYEGSKKDLDYSIPADTVEDAEDWFVDAKDRLWNVNHWEQNSPAINVQFKLTDTHGNAVNRKAHKGDHIRIDTEGAGTGFDWVIIEAIEYDDYPDVNLETFAIHVRPSYDPKENQFVLSADNNATSTIVIERRVKRLIASYHGRNEGAGEDTPGTGDAAWLGLSELQWGSLLKGLLDPL